MATTLDDMPEWGKESDIPPPKYPNLNEAKTKSTLLKLDFSSFHTIVDVEK